MLNDTPDCRAHALLLVSLSGPIVQPFHNMPVVKWLYFHTQRSEPFNIEGIDKNLGCGF